MARKEIKVVVRRKKFVEVEVPFKNVVYELIGNKPEDVDGRKIKLDLTRDLRGKGVEATLDVRVENGRAVANLRKLRIMPYFIRRIFRRGVRYVEDSFIVNTKESQFRVKPFMITRKKVSRAVRKTLRNRARNWIESYFPTKTDEELFQEILSNKIQKALSLELKKTYPLAFCDIRVLEKLAPLEKKEENITPSDETSEEDSTKKKEEITKQNEESDEKKEVKDKKTKNKTSKKSTKKEEK